MQIENRYYSAKEVLEIIKDGWKKEPEEMKEIINFLESIKMNRFERRKVINSDEVSLLYSMYDQLEGIAY